MIPAAEVEKAVGHAPAGSAPLPSCRGSKSIWTSRCGVFGSLSAARDAHSAVRLTPDELAELSHSLAWVDCCKDWTQG